MGKIISGPFFYSKYGSGWYVCPTRKVSHPSEHLSNIYCFSIILDYVFQFAESQADVSLQPAIEKRKILCRGSKETIASSSSNLLH